MDFQDILALASARRVDELVPTPKGVAYARYRLPDYPYAGGGNVCLYAICDQEQVLFVDCGPLGMTDRTWFSQVIDQCAESADQARLFLTHLHCDHAGEAAWFASQGIGRAINGASARFASMDAQECERAFGSARYDLPFGVAEYCAMQAGLWESLGQTDTVEDWDLLTVGDMRFETMPLPGHAVGQNGLISKDKTLLFSGDCLCQNPSVFAWELDRHDVAAAMESWSGLLAYPLEWVATSHYGFFEGEEEIQSLIKDQIAGVDSRGKQVLQALRDMRGYRTASGFVLEMKGEAEIIDASSRAGHLNALRLCQSLAYLEFLYDYEKVHRSFDDDGCAVYEPARFTSFFA